MYIYASSLPAVQMLGTLGEMGGHDWHAHAWERVDAETPVDTQSFSVSLFSWHARTAAKKSNFEAESSPNQSYGLAFCVFLLFVFPSGSEMKGDQMRCTCVLADDEKHDMPATDAPISFAQPVGFTGQTKCGYWLFDTDREMAGRWDVVNQGIGNCIVSILPYFRDLVKISIRALMKG